MYFEASKLTDTLCSPATRNSTVHASKLLGRLSTTTFINLAIEVTRYLSVLPLDYIPGVLAKQRLTTTWFNEVTSSSPSNDKIHCPKSCSIIFQILNDIIARFIWKLSKMKRKIGVSDTCIIAV